MPGYANPQAFNRYSYVYNNPINYVDASGHLPGYFDPVKSVKGLKLPPPGTTPNPTGGGGGGRSGRSSSDGGGGGGSGGNSDEEAESVAYNAISEIDDPLARTAAYATAGYYFNAWKLDAWLYQNVPSAFGLTLSGSFGGSLILGGVLDVSPTTYIFNWRSFELDVVSTADGGITLGYPPGPSGSLYASGFVVKGASENESWFGQYASIAGGGYVGPGAIAGSAVGINSLDITDPFIDPVSRQTVWTFFGGVGLGSPQVGVSITTGGTFLEEDIFDLDLPISLIPPNNPYIP